MTPTAPFTSAEPDGRPGRPLRVVVLASSVGYYVRPRDPVAGRPYPELLEASLRLSGTDADVINHSNWFGMIHEAFPDIQRTVVPYSPDVVILNYGILEAESTLMPTALVRNLYRWDPTTNRLVGAARRIVLRPLHLFHKDIAPGIMRRVGSFHRLSPHRFEEELCRTVQWLRRERNALVLVLNINPVGDNVEVTLPGTRASVERYNTIIRRVVESQADERTRLIDIHSIVARENSGGALVADGIHFTAQGHRVVAGLLERQIDLGLRR